MFGEDITSEAGRYLVGQGILGIVVLFQFGAIVWLVAWIRSLYKELFAEKDGRREDGKELQPLISSVETALGANTAAYNSLTEYVKLQFEILRDRVSR